MRLFEFIRKTDFDAIGLVVLRLYTSLVSFVISIVLARLYDIESVSSYFIAISVLMILNQIVILGLQTPILKLFGEERGDLINIKVKLSSYFLLSSSSLFFCILLAIPILSGLVSEDVSIAIISCLVPYFLLVFTGLVYQGEGAHFKGVLIGNAIQPTLLLLMLSLGLGESVMDMMSISFVLSALCIFPSTCSLFRKYLCKVNLSTVARHAKVIPDFFLLSILGCLFSNLPIVFSSYAFESQVVAYLGVSIRLLGVLNFISSSFCLRVSSNIAYQYSVNNMVELKNISNKTITNISIIGLPICVFLLVFPETYLVLFGDEYTYAKPMVMLVCAAQAYNYLTATGPLLLCLSGYQRIQVFSQVFLLILNLIIYYIIYSVGLGYNYILASIVFNYFFGNLIAVLFCKVKLGFYPVLGLK